MWDHPRLCGEKVLTGTKNDGFMGSPPPMRGKARSCKSAGDATRITPAYAGKSAQYFTNHAPRLDHPRLCGEKVTVAVPLIPYSGSPPPMRGKAVFLRCGYTAGRITPAYAGKSQARPQQADTSEDHPRLCGEKPSLIFVVIGSIGITPAYAGKSECITFVQTCREDHPRLCGEKESMYRPNAINEGSPPPMRGKE